MLLTDTLHSLWDWCYWTCGQKWSLGLTLHGGCNEWGWAARAQAEGLCHQECSITLVCWLFSTCSQPLENAGVQSHWEPCERWGVATFLCLGCDRLTLAVTSSPYALGTAPGIRYPSFAQLWHPLTWVRALLKGLEQWYRSRLLRDEGDSLLPTFMYTTNKAWTCPCSHSLGFYQARANRPVRDGQPCEDPVSMCLPVFSSIWVAVDTKTETELLFLII